MQTSVIVSTYNNPKALKLCLLSLAEQSVLPSEVLIADDGSNSETHDLVPEIQKMYRQLFPIKHVWHEDIAFRKPKILNDAVRQASGDYLIFIDGDCMAHRQFVLAHVENSDPSAILGGRRVEIGKHLTGQLLMGSKILNKFDIRLALDSIFGDSRKVEEAIQISNGALRRLFHRDKIINTSVLGCNCSLYKKLYMDVNGYDEDFLYAVEDNDLGIRVFNQGNKIKSVRGLAIVFHLWHPIRWNFENEKYQHDLEILKRRIANRETMCKNGIRKL